MVKAAAGRAKKSKQAAKSTRPTKTAKTKPPVKLPSSFLLTAHSFSLLKNNWKVFSGVFLIYLALNILFISGLSRISDRISNLNFNLETSSGSAVGDSLTGFGSLFGIGGNTEGSSFLQTLLVILVSLVIIWSLRQRLAGKKISVKEAYYNSMQPLVPFILIIGVLILQLLPVTFGTAALGVVLTSVFTNDGLITLLSSVLFVALAAASLYLISSSIFALYIVTIPGMHPRLALKSAKDLVRSRRFAIIRKVLFLPLFLIVTLAIIVLPLILVSPTLAVVVFYLLGLATIFFIHTYLYSLYRSLL